MAANINVVVVVGNLTRDPELKHLPSGTALCELRIAVNSRVKRNDAWEDKANYFDVSVWGNQGESCAQYLAKGRPVAVHGRLDYQEWEAKDGGGKRSKVVIIADSVQFLNARGDGEGQQSFQGGGSSGQSSSGGSGDFGDDFAPASPDDDIPF